VQHQYLPTTPIIVKDDGVRFLISFCAIASIPLLMGAALSAQSFDDQQSALRTAKAKAAAAEQRSEELRQEASNAERAADRLVAQRAVLSADIDAAAAQIEAGKARIAIINARQNAQRRLLGEASEPMLRLNAALQQITQRPTAVMMMQQGERTNYIHLRAVMATVEPAIRRRTAALRQQIALQKDLRAQELVALKSLGDAQTNLSSRRSALAKLVGNNQDRANSLSADAAIEFEQAIAQGERARDIVEQIDTDRTGGDLAASLAGLSGPILRTGSPPAASAANDKKVYLLPDQSQLVSGFNELNETGYRERGIQIMVQPSASIAAPAGGKVTFAGTYRSFGEIVIIDHGSGWMTLVTGLAALSVDKGDSVRQGGNIGTAATENPRVGFELRRNGRTMDIAALL
jgi:murein hydrolase activator